MTEITKLIPAEVSCFDEETALFRRQHTLSCLVFGRAQFSDTQFSDSGHYAKLNKLGDKKTIGVVREKYSIFFLAINYHF